MGEGWGPGVRNMKKRGTEGLGSRKGEGDGVLGWSQSGWAIKEGKCTREEKLAGMGGERMRVQGFLGSGQRVQNGRQVGGGLWGGV